MEFSEACCEVEFILNHLNPEDKKKIPNSVFDLFKDNKSVFYKVNLTVEEPLAKQDLKDETKAILQILKYKYFSNKDEKELFKKKLQEENKEILLAKEASCEDEYVENKEMVVYKESKLKTIFLKILNFFRKK